MVRHKSRHLNSSYFFCWCQYMCIYELFGFGSVVLEVVSSYSTMGTNSLFFFPVLFSVYRQMMIVSIHPSFLFLVCSMSLFLQSHVSSFLYQFSVIDPTYVVIPRPPSCSTGILFLLMTTYFV